MNNDLLCVLHIHQVRVTLGKCRNGKTITIIQLCLGTTRRHEKAITGRTPAHILHLVALVRFNRSKCLEGLIHPVKVPELDFVIVAAG